MPEVFDAVSFVLVAVAGEQLIRLIFGEQFIGAYPALIVLIIAPLLAMIAFPMPAMPLPTRFREISSRCASLP